MSEIEGKHEGKGGPSGLPADRPTRWFVKRWELAQAPRGVQTVNYAEAKAPGFTFQPESGKAARTFTEEEMRAMLDDIEAQATATIKPETFRKFSDEAISRMLQKQYQSEPLLYAELHAKSFDKHGKARRLARKDLKRIAEKNHGTFSSELTKKDKGKGGHIAMAPSEKVPQVVPEIKVPPKPIIPPPSMPK